MRPAPVGWVDRIKPAKIARIDGPLRDLVGRVPLRRVAHRRNVEAIGDVALAVTQHAVDLSVAIRMEERTVVLQTF